MPTANASIQWARDRNQTDVINAPLLSSNNDARFRADTLSLEWVLFDFGARYEEMQNAQQLLVAATQTHAATLQQVFVQTARDYYEAAAAQTTVQSAREMERAAKQSLDAASGRVHGGVAAVSDQLQAQTAYAQAVYARARAEGMARTALGTLALDMGLPPDSRFELAEVLDGPLSDVTFIKSLDALLAEARQRHPAILAGQAAVDAARSRQKSILAQALPSVSLTGRISHNTQPVSLGLGLNELDARANDRYVGITLSIPIFEGFSSVYKARAAEADLETQQDKLLDTEQQVAQQVWSGYQTFMINTENVHNTDTVLRSARLQYNAASERYRLGITNILELMSAQTTLSQALQQRIQSLADWRISRLDLAASIGILGSWAVR